MEETILLNFEVDQTQAQQNLIQTEKNIISLKKQQAELNKEYKEGKISEDQYVESNLKMQKALKTEGDQKKTLTRLLDTESNSRNAMRNRVSQLNQEYNNLNLTTEKGIKRADALQKELTQLNAELNKGSKAAGQFKDNIGNYPQQFGEAAKSINIAGTSVGDLGTKFTGLLNPVTATVGVLTGLVSLYASSTTGARDFAFAQSQLSSATSLVAEGLANLVSTGEDGEGLFSSIVSRLLQSIPAIGDISKAMAEAAQNLKDLEISRAFAAGFAKDDERRAELARRIRDDEEASFEVRLKAAQEIDAVLERSGQRTTTIIKAQIEGIKGTTVAYENNREAQLKVAQLTAEIADKEEEITGKLTENVKAREAIQKTIRDLNRADRRGNADEVRSSIDGVERQDRADPLTNAFQNDLDIEEDATRNFNDRVLKGQKDFENERIRQANRSAEARIELEKKVADAQINATVGILGSISSLFDQQSEEYKAFATFQTVISTYSAAQKAYEAAFIPPTVASPALGAAYVAAAIAQGLANVAAIHGVEFAEGGWTGPGSKYQVAGVVHADEYVAPKHIVNSPAAQPHISALENMRLRGYADGGFVTNQNISATQQALIMANAVKNIPPGYVSWSEGRDVGRRVEMRERTAKI